MRNMRQGVEFIFRSRNGGQGWTWFQKIFIIEKRGNWQIIRYLIYPVYLLEGLIAYWILVNTTQVNSFFCTWWLASLEVNSEYYSLPNRWWDKIRCQGLISDDFFGINLLFRYLCAIKNYLPQCWWKWWILTFRGETVSRNCYSVTIRG